MSGTTELEESPAVAGSGTGDDVSHMLLVWEYPVTFCGHVTSRPMRDTPSQATICAVCLAQAAVWGINP